MYNKRSIIVQHWSAFVGRYMVNKSVEGPGTEEKNVWCYCFVIIKQICKERMVLSIYFCLTCCSIELFCRCWEQEVLLSCGRMSQLEVGVDLLKPRRTGCTNWSLVLIYWTCAWALEITISPCVTPCSFQLKSTCARASNWTVLNNWIRMWKN